MRTNEFKENETESSVAAQLAAEAVRGHIAEAEGRAFLITPRGDGGGVDIAEVLKRDAHGNLTDLPGRIVSAVTVQTQDSLSAYVNDFKSEGTRLFADIFANSIVAVLDYAEGRTDALSGVVMKGTDSIESLLTGFRDHVATLSLPFSEEWKVWTKADGTLMSQNDFARFVLENQPDFLNPDHATMRELVNDLRATRNVKFTAEVNVNAETESFEYADRTDVHRRDNLEIPSSFTIKIPVYFGGRSVEVMAQLRHGVDSETGALKLGFKLLRLEQVRQAVFKELVTEVSDQTGAPVVYGKAVTPDRSKLAALPV